MVPEFLTCRSNSGTELAERDPGDLDARGVFGEIDLAERDNADLSEVLKRSNGTETSDAKDKGQKKGKDKKAKKKKGNKGKKKKITTTTAAPLAAATTASD